MRTQGETWYMNKTKAVCFVTIFCLPKKCEIPSSTVFLEIPSFMDNKFLLVINVHSRIWIGSPKNKTHCSSRSGNPSFHVWRNRSANPPWVVDSSDESSVLVEMGHPPGERSHVPPPYRKFTGTYSRKVGHILLVTLPRFDDEWKKCRVGIYYN